MQHCVPLRDCFPHAKESKRRLCANDCDCADSLVLECASKNGSRWSSRSVQTLFGHPTGFPGARTAAATRENHGWQHRLDCPALSHPSDSSSERATTGEGARRHVGRVGPKESIIGESREYTFHEIRNVLRTRSNYNMRNVVHTCDSQMKCVVPQSVQLMLRANQPQVAAATNSPACSSAPQRMDLDGHHEVCRRCLVIPLASPAPARRQPPAKTAGGRTAWTAPPSRTPPTAAQNEPPPERARDSTWGG